MFANGSNLTFTGLRTDGCNARDAILTVNGAGQQDDASSAVLNSKFSNATTQGLTIVDCNIVIYNTVFDRLSHNGANGGAFSISNRDGSGAQISYSNFTHNSVFTAGNHDDGTGYALMHQFTHESRIMQLALHPAVHAVLCATRHD